MSQDGTEATSPFRRPTFIMSAVFLAAVVLFGAVMLRISGDDPGTSGNPPPATTTNAGASTGCRPTDTDQRTPSAAPAVEWQVFKVMALPRSATAGPMQIDGDIARCYAHTPTGALMAAAQIGFRYSVTSQWKKLAAAQLVDGPGKQAFLAERAASPSPATPQQGFVAQIAGFRFITYDPSTAVVQLAYRNPAQNTFLPATFTVKWRNGDWMLELQPDGAANPDNQESPSLEGFTPWGGI